MNEGRCPGRSSLCCRCLPPSAASIRKEGLARAECARVGNPRAAVRGVPPGLDVPAPLVDPIEALQPGALPAKSIQRVIIRAAALGHQDLTQVVAM